ncbi:MAG: hypothetical protein QNJ72_28655 [Pleurocapsa sp. MO_226.B13]|nr:hypothetical protein [Pleurocapsa sp. MO_226.B13]
MSLGVQHPVSEHLPHIRQPHRKKEVAYGGTDEEFNLIHVHQKCHRQIHGKRAMSR